MSTNISHGADLATEFSVDGPCASCGFDPDTIPEGALPAMLRSLPGQWRRALAVHLDHPDPEQLLVGRPHGGWSALEHAGHVRDVLHALDIRLQRVLREDRPVLPETHTTPPSGANEQGAPIILAALGVSAEQLAQTAEMTPETGWSRKGRRSGREVTALDLVREAYHEGIHHLTDAVAVIDHMRSAAPSGIRSQ